MNATVPKTPLERQSYFESSVEKVIHLAVN